MLLFSLNLLPLVQHFRALGEKVREYWKRVGMKGTHAQYGEGVRVAPAAVSEGRR